MACTRKSWSLPPNGDRPRHTHHRQSCAMASGRLHPGAIVGRADCMALAPGRRLTLRNSHSPGCWLEPGRSKPARRDDTPCSRARAELAGQARILDQASHRTLRRNWRGQFRRRPGASHRSGGSPAPNATPAAEEPGPPPETDQAATVAAWAIKTAWMRKETEPGDRATTPQMRQAPTPPGTTGPGTPRMSERSGPGPSRAHPVPGLDVRHSVRQN